MKTYEYRELLKNGAFQVVFLSIDNEVIDMITDKVRDIKFNDDISKAIDELINRNDISTYKPFTVYDVLVNNDTSKIESVVKFDFDSDGYKTGKLYTSENIENVEEVYKDISSKYLSYLKRLSPSEFFSHEDITDNIFEYTMSNGGYTRIFLSDANQILAHSSNKSNVDKSVDYIYNEMSNLVSKYDTDNTKKLTAFMLVFNNVDKLVCVDAIYINERSECGKIDKKILEKLHVTPAVEKDLNDKMKKYLSENECGLCEL